MKEFFEEFFYLCSANNTKSRGFYIMIGIGLILLSLGFVGATVLCIIMAIKGFFKLYYLILALVALVLLVAIIIWLKRS